MHNSHPAGQVDRDEVRLRRTVGLKKDEYTLDKKHVTWVAQSRFCICVSDQ